jgi:hypothetical protein
MNHVEDHTALIDRLWLDLTREVLPVTRHRLGSSTGISLSCLHLISWINALQKKARFHVPRILHAADQ